MSLKWLNCIRACGLVVLSALIGCQTIDPEKQPKSASSVAKPNQTVQYEPISVPGKILLAEALLRQNKLDSALDLYSEAAFMSMDPKVVQRAVVLARQSDAVNKTRILLHRWRVLAPSSVDAIEAQIIFESQNGESATIRRNIDELLTLDTEYDGLWIGSIWAGLKDTQKANFLAAVESSANTHNNSTLAIIVTELKNRQEINSGTLWLEQWMGKNSLTEDILLFRARLDMPDLDKAISRLEQYPNISESPEVKSQLARWFGLNDDLDRAKTLLTEIIEADSSRYQDIFTLGLLEMQTKQFDTAEIHLKKLLSQEQFRANVYYHLGELAKETNRPTIAIDRFLRVDRGTLIVEARKQAAALAIQGGDADSADRWFHEARLLYPHLKAELWLGEAQIQTQNQRADSAISILNSEIAKTPNNVELLYIRALAFEQLDQIEDAERDLRTILAKNPSDPDALNALGYTLADRTKRFDEALKLITQALEAKPDSPAILDSMGWVLFKLSRHSEALQFLEQAWEIARDHEIAAHYGEVLWVIGEREKALEIWDLGYESNPESEIIRSTINRLVNS